MKFLVTGGTGFIGACVVANLLARNIPVAVADVQIDQDVVAKLERAAGAGGACRGDQGVGALGAQAVGRGGEAVGVAQVRVAGQGGELGDDHVGLGLGHSAGDRGAVEGVGAVSHQAAMVGLGADIGDIADYVAHNDLGTAVLLRALAPDETAMWNVIGVFTFTACRHGAFRPRSTSCRW